MDTLAGASMDPIAIASIAVALVAALAAIAVIRPTLRASAPATVARNLDEFQQQSVKLRNRQVALGDQFLEAAPSHWRVGDVPLLTRPGWVFDAPRELESIALRFNPRPSNSSELVSASRVMKGLALSQPLTYSEAIRAASASDRYFNGMIYRPVGVNVDDAGQLSMEFEEGRYFDYLDTSEVLAFEAAGESRKRALRTRINDPFDLRARVASLGILTLTLRTSSSGTTFVMHRRSGQFVVGDGLFHVVPAGEFTPSDIGLAAVKDDFSLWRNIMREYAEELLGISDAQGQGGRRIGYESDEPYALLARARSDGKLTVFALGLGLDALTYKPELLTVCVFDDEVFKSAFPTIVQTPEGTVIEDIPFSQEHVEMYLRHPNTRHGAKACLRLAWRSRQVLGLQRS
jgi:hypothetical protein